MILGPSCIALRVEGWIATPKESACRRSRRAKEHAPGEVPLQPSAHNVRAGALDLNTPLESLALFTFFWSKSMFSSMYHCNAQWCLLRIQHVSQEQNALTPWSMPSWAWSYASLDIDVKEHVLEDVPLQQGPLPRPWPCHPTAFITSHCPASKRPGGPLLYPFTTAWLSSGPHDPLESGR